MRDANLAFSTAQALTSDAWSEAAVEVDKTPVEGLSVEVIVPTGFPTGTSPSLNVNAYARAADSGWATTDPLVGSVRNITAAGRYHLFVHTDLAFVKLHYDTSGTSPDFGTVDAYVVSGPEAEDVH
jgi:hypothetical protein